MPGHAHRAYIEANEARQREATMATRQYNRTSVARPRGESWVMFACLLLGLAGIFNVIDGIVALSRSKFYVADATYAFSDLRTWGWIVLVVGVLEVVAAYTIFAGSQLARWFGIAVAGINALAQLGFAHAYPFWALCMFAADIIVIYALAAYGGSKLRTR
jgi:hypothetical protein